MRKSLKSTSPSLDLDFLIMQISVFEDSLSEESENHLRRTEPRQPPPSPSPHWELWDFDYAFFEELGRWNDKFPLSTFDYIFNKINIGVQRVEPLFQLIPESPFPARGLVKALAHLVTLGATVARAKSEVQEFASQTVKWVTKMTEALRAGAVTRENFNRKTKQNLEKRCTLIRAICTRAIEILYDRRWAQISKRLSISSEVGEFKAQVVEARTLFMDLSMVDVSRLQMIDNIFKKQRKVSLGIEEVCKVQQNQFRRILEAQARKLQEEERRRFMNHMLRSQVVVNSSYTKQGKQPCDSDTRVDILADIHTWISDISASAKSFLWLTGDPGSGKSAIAASIARDCKHSGILWAQFFINRNDVDTTNPKSYFPTIARQLAKRYPGSEVALAIHDALKKKESLVNNISTEQARRLFTDAIQLAAKLDPKTPVVIVIDGLDESERSRLVNTAEIFSSLFGTLRCPNVKVIISSRIDDEIQRSFVQANHVEYVKHVHLDTAAESSIRDVSLFLTRRIGEIVEENNLNWEQWPGQERMQALCIRASGLFIWAVTSAKFFREQINLLGTAGLDQVWDALSSDGLGDINALYSTILNLTYEGAGDWEFKTFRLVVGCIITQREPVSIGAIGDMLGLRNRRNSDPVYLINFFRRLKTILVAGVDGIDAKTVLRMHPSFREYITSDRVDPRFCVQLPEEKHETAENQPLIYRSTSKRHGFESQSLFQSVADEWTVESTKSVLLSATATDSFAEVRQEDALVVVNILDHITGDPSCDAELGRKALKHLSKLCGKHGVLPDSHIIPYSPDFSNTTPVATGAFGAVYRDVYNGIPVAVKVFKVWTVHIPSGLKQMFCREAVAWKHLSHENVVPFLGAFFRQTMVSLVSVWMEYGNIHEYKKTRPDANLLELLTDVGAGVEYMHSRLVVHGDLKGANILISGDGRALLSDFGLMKIAQDSVASGKNTSSRTSAGTTRWMAPELINPEAFNLQHGNPTRASDVYALGMVILEVLTGKHPFSECSKDHQVIFKIMNCAQPSRPDNVLNITDALWALLQNCWKAARSERPKAGVVLDRLRDASKSWVAQHPDTIKVTNRIATISLADMSDEESY